MDRTWVHLGTNFQSETTSFKNLITINGSHQVNKCKILLFLFNIKAAIGAFGGAYYALFGQRLQNLRREKLRCVYLPTNIFDAKLYPLVVLGPDINHRSNTVFTSF